MVNVMLMGPFAERDHAVPITSSVEARFSVRRTVDDEVDLNVANMALLCDELSLHNKDRPFTRAPGECHKRAAKWLRQLRNNECGAGHLLCEVEQSSPVVYIKANNPASAADQPPFTALSFPTRAKRTLRERM
jgi:hypothetical protein